MTIGLMDVYVTRCLHPVGVVVSTHRLIADLVRVAVPEPSPKGVPVWREKRADVLQRRDLELVGAAQDHLPGRMKEGAGQRWSLCMLQIWAHASFKHYEVY